MPIMAPVNVSQLLTPGIDSAWTQSYADQYNQSAARLGPMIRLAVPSTKAYEIYGYAESAPHARRWVRGQARSFEGFDSVQYQVTNLKYENNVEAYLDDIEDEQTSSVEARAMEAGKHMARLSERVAFQIRGATTNPDLLPAIPNAPDGAAIFSATTGSGADRFGVLGGNIISGTGVATAGAVRTDFFSAVLRIRSFLDTKGQPFYSDDLSTSEFLVVYKLGNDQLFREAFIQSITAQVVKNVAATENVAAAGVTNIVYESGLKVRLCPSVFVTDNDWDVYAAAAPVPPIFQQTRRTQRMLPKTPENDTDCANYDMLRWMWDTREGYGVNIPIGCCQVNN